MTFYTGPDPASRTTNPRQSSHGPIPGERYQVPAEHANAVPGSVLTYGGNNDVANKDGTMTALTATL